jgi:hypothetical protein
MKTDYGSRKFIITSVSILLGTVVTMYCMYADKDPNAGFYILLAAGITAYNWANLRQSQNGSAP